MALRYPTNFRRIAERRRQGANLARPILPPEARRAQSVARAQAALARDAAELATENLRERLGTRQITARLRTGIAGRRGVATDITLNFNMQPMVSALTGGTSSRVQLAGYNEEAEVVRVVFRDGTPWEYYGVGPGEWDSFRTSPSPGRAIREILDAHPNGRGNF